MEANELRIGSLVSFEGKIYNVTGIDIVAGECIVFINSEPHNIKKINPIRLTEEWLLRFGLEQGYDWLLRKPKGLYSIPTGEQSLLFDLDNGLHYETEINDGSFYLGITKIEYVHQLQNLYFALTGKELTPALTDK